MKPNSFMNTTTTIALNDKSNTIIDTNNNDSMDSNLNHNSNSSLKEDIMIFDSSSLQQQQQQHNSSSSQHIGSASGTTSTSVSSSSDHSSGNDTTTDVNDTSATPATIRKAMNSSGSCSDSSSGETSSGRNQSSAMLNTSGSTATSNAHTTDDDNDSSDKKSDDSDDESEETEDEDDNNTAIDAATTVTAITMEDDGEDDELRGSDARMNASGISTAGSNAQTSDDNDDDSCGKTSDDESEETEEGDDKNTAIDAFTTATAITMEDEDDELQDSDAIINTTSRSHANNNDYSDPEFEISIPEGIQLTSEQMQALAEQARSMLRNSNRPNENNTVPPPTYTQEGHDHDDESSSTEDLEENNNDDENENNNIENSIVGRYYDEDASSTDAQADPDSDNSECENNHHDNHHHRSNAAAMSSSNSSTNSSSSSSSHTNIRLSLHHSLSQQRLVTVSETEEDVDDTTTASSSSTSSLAQQQQQQAQQQPGEQPQGHGNNSVSNRNKRFNRSSDTISTTSTNLILLEDNDSSDDNDSCQDDDDDDDGTNLPPEHPQDNNSDSTDQRSNGIGRNVSDTSQMTEYSNASTNIILLENHPNNNTNNDSGDDDSEDDDDEAPSFHYEPQRQQQPQDTTSSFHNSFATTVSNASTNIYMLDRAGGSVASCYEEDTTEEMISTTSSRPATDQRYPSEPQHQQHDPSDSHTGTTASAYYSNTPLYRSHATNQHDLSSDDETNIILLENNPAGDGSTSTVATATNHSGRMSRLLVEETDDKSKSPPKCIRYDSEQTMSPPENGHHKNNDDNYYSHDEDDSIQSEEEESHTIRRKPSDAEKQQQQCTAVDSAATTTINSKEITTPIEESSTIHFARRRSISIRTRSNHNEDSSNDTTSSHCSSNVDKEEAALEVSKAVTGKAMTPKRQQLQLEPILTAELSSKSSGLTLFTDNSQLSTSSLNPSPPRLRTHDETESSSNGDTKDNSARKAATGNSEDISSSHDDDHDESDNESEGSSPTRKDRKNEVSTSSGNDDDSDGSDRSSTDHQSAKKKFVASTAKATEIFPNGSTPPVTAPNHRHSGDGSVKEDSTASSTSEDHVVMNGKAKNSDKVAQNDNNNLAVKDSEPQSEMDRIADELRRIIEDAMVDINSSGRNVTDHADLDHDDDDNRSRSSEDDDNVVIASKARILKNGKNSTPKEDSPVSSSHDKSTSSSEEEEDAESSDDQSSSNDATVETSEEEESSKESASSEESTEVDDDEADDDKGGAQRSVGKVPPKARSTDVHEPSFSTDGKETHLRPDRPLLPCSMKQSNGRIDPGGIFNARRSRKRTVKVSDSPPSAMRNRITQQLYRRQYRDETADNKLGIDGLNLTNVTTRKGCVDPPSMSSEKMAARSVLVQNASDPPDAGDNTLIYYNDPLIERMADIRKQDLRTRSDPPTIGVGEDNTVSNIGISRENRRFNHDDDRARTDPPTATASPLQNERHGLAHQMMDSLHQSILRLSSSKMALSPTDSTEADDVESNEYTGLPTSSATTTTGFDIGDIESGDGADDDAEQFRKEENRNNDNGHVTPLQPGRLKNPSRQSRRRSLSKAEVFVLCIFICCVFGLIIALLFFFRNKGSNGSTTVPTRNNNVTNGTIPWNLTTIPPDNNNISINEDAISWNLSETFTGVVGSGFGGTVAIGDGRMVVGEASSPSAGGLKSYTLSPNNNSWIQDNFDIPFDQENSRFGASIDIVGNRMVVGAPLATVDSIVSGAVYFYVYSETASSWQRLIIPLRTGNDPSIDEGEEFGSAVAVCNDFIAVVGAPKNSLVNQEAGRVYTYQLRRNDSLVWEPMETFPLVGTTSGNRFGSSVALSSDGRFMIAAAPGDGATGGSMGYVQTYSWEATTWKDMGRLEGSEENEYFGSSIVMLSERGTTFAVGCPGYQNKSGRVIVYQQDAATAAYRPVGPPIVGEPGDEIGFPGSLSSSSNNIDRLTIVVGTKSGQVKRFDYNPDRNVWEELFQRITLLSGGLLSVDFASNGTIDMLVVGSYDHNNVSVYTTSSLNQ